MSVKKFSRMLKVNYWTIKSI